MNKLWIRKIINYLLKLKLVRKSLDYSVWFVTNRLSENKKQYIKDKLSLKQKERLKRIISGGRLNSKERILQIKYKLLELGFEEKAYEEISELVHKNKDSPHLKREAAWELALLHADRKNPEDAVKALEYIDIMKLEKQLDKTTSRQCSILQAELLNLLGKKSEARSILEKEESINCHPDLLLALANMETEAVGKLARINQVMKSYKLSEIDINVDKSKTLYDQLVTHTNDSFSIEVLKLPKVSVIMPVYNSEQVIETAVRSVLGQTWTNLELIIVDDCSTDSTMEKVEEYAKSDHRIKILSTKVNSGTYVARNVGLRSAEGEFVTCHDADDWSHAQKIEKQALHIMQNPKVIANMSEQCRLTEELNFYRRKQLRNYISVNMSSLLFRRDIVVEKLGGWDNVRFGADGEFVRRIKKMFGENSVLKLSTGPLSFPRVSESSLTGSGYFGYNGFFYGTRKEYVEGFTYYHRTSENLRYDLSKEESRPFVIPEPMKPDRLQPTEPRHFDVVIASDFRLTGGTTTSNLEEIKAQCQAGLKTGLIQMSRYQGSADRSVNVKIREAIDGNQVQMLVYGETITCDVLIVRHPPVLQELQRYIPQVKAKRVCVIVNQTPRVDYSEHGAIAYDIQRCKQHLEEYFGQPGTWYPIGPLVRQTLIDFHSKELEGVDLAGNDWVNIININEWKRTTYTRIDRIRIGRHSRDQYVKWPSDPEQLLQIYPVSGKYEIHILGGAKIPENTLGKLPRNWKVWEFGEIEPREFLTEIDVFIYFVHPECVEAFGRVIIEAMAVGVPVILPHSYAHLFGEAAIYAEPFEVNSKVEQLMTNQSYYNSQVETAYKYLENSFGYPQHLIRINSISLERSGYE